MRMREAASLTEPRKQFSPAFPTSSVSLSSPGHSVRVCAEARAFLPSEDSPPLIPPPHLTPAHFLSPALQRDTLQALSVLVSFAQ